MKLAGADAGESTLIGDAINIDMKVKVVPDNESPLTEYNFYDSLTDDLIKL